MGRHPADAGLCGGMVYARGPHYARTFGQRWRRGNNPPARPRGKPLRPFVLRVLGTDVLRSNLGPSRFRAQGQTHRRRLNDWRRLRLPAVWPIFVFARR